jgi:hypothetical protein
MMKDWSDGVREDWSTGVLEYWGKEEKWQEFVQYSITPLLHYSRLLFLHHSVTPVPRGLYS